MNMMRGVARSMLGSPREPLVPVTWQMLLKFAVDAAAPLASPLVGDVGSIPIVDSASVMSQSGGALVLNGTAAASNDGLLSSVITRAPGLATVMTLPARTTMNTTFGWDASGGLTNNNSTVGFDYSGTTVLRAKIGTSAPFTATLGAGIHCLICVLRSTGGFILSRVGLSGDWRLFWVFNTLNTNAMIKVRPSGAVNYALGMLGLLDLSLLDARFATDYGLATARLATTVNGDTIAAEGNAIVEHTITAQTGVTQELMIRRTDDNNCWILRQGPPGTDTIKLIEKVAGVETERDSDASVTVNGTQYRIVAIMRDTNIQSTVALAAKSNYNSASFNSTETGVKVSHAGVDLVSWPLALMLPANFDAELAVA